MPLNLAAARAAVAFDLGDGGRVLIYLGDEDPAKRAEPDIILYGTQGWEQAGWSVAGGHDTDGDGKLELLVGAPGASIGSGGEGRVYLVRVDWSPDGILAVQRQSRDQQRLDLLFVDPESGEVSVYEDGEWQRHALHAAEPATEQESVSL